MRNNLLLKLTLVSLIICFKEIQIHGNVQIVFTAALLEKDYTARKAEYITSLQQLHNYGYTNPYIIESHQKTNAHSFLNDYSDTVLYTHTNDLQLRNKGVNEVRSLIKACKQWSHDDHDIIVKITGRYRLISREFLETVENHPTVDAFVKLASDGQVYTGCFAMRYKFFKEMLNQIDCAKMENDMINFEQEVAKHLAKLKNQHARIMYVTELHLYAPIWGNGTRHEVSL